MAATKPTTPVVPAAGAPPARFRVALNYALSGDLRYLSHRDELRMLIRAAVRAAWPLRYSRGFNPLPRIVLPLPRGVGIASDCQWALVDLNAARAPDALFDDLAEHLPADCRLLRVVALVAPATPQVLRVVEEVRLSAADAACARDRIGELMAREQLPTDRSRGPDKSSVLLDIRPLIHDLTLRRSVLRVTLLFDRQRTARTAEILTALGLSAADYKHHVRRREIEWKIEFAGPSAGPAAPERNESERPTRCTVADTG